MVNKSLRHIILSFILLFSCSGLSGTTIIRNTAQGIELRNNIVAILISEKAELISCKEIATGEDIAAREHKRIANAKTSRGEYVEANRALLDGNVLKLEIGGVFVEVKVDAYSSYFTFEVLPDVPSSLQTFTFVDFKFNYNYSSSNSLVAAGVAMSLQTDPVNFPSGESRELLGRCYSRIGMAGSKLGVTICRKDSLQEILKNIYASIPEFAVPMSPYGGPYATESDYNKGTRLIVRGLAPDKVQEYIDFCQEWDISQLDFILGNNTFKQGQFSFPSTGSGVQFKKLITEPLQKAGIISLMHTYSFYISYDSTDILSNPKWQQQLEFRNTSTIAHPISSTTTRIDIRGDKSVLKKDQSFWSLCSPFILIDNEIIKYKIGENGYVSCKRGQCGTIATAHKAGSKVRIIGGRISYIAPQPGSDLFYEIAHRTAKAYNEAGFKGFYFDAFAGLSIHLENAGLQEYLWYYGAAFINEVLKYCIEPPVVEYSTLYPTLWAARGRGGAWDTPRCGYKQWVDMHTLANADLIKRLYVPTLGWYNFYPVDQSLPNGYATKYMFSDDVDYLGVKSIAFDQSMVYNDFTESDVNSIPALRRNLIHYMDYNRLYKSNYFSQKVKTLLKHGKHEYRLLQKDGEWGFQEVEYNSALLRDIKTSQLTGYNPFKKQKPFIRLENLFSAASNPSKLLMAFDVDRSLASQCCSAVFQTPINISNQLALQVSIKGNGLSSKGAICIRLRASNTNGFADYIVRTNFNGWRDVVITEMDNGNYPDLRFSGLDEEKYKTFRHPVNFSSINSVSVFMTDGCDGVRLKEIVALPRVPNALINPSVKIGNATIIFGDKLDSGEYVEYIVGDDTATIFNSIGEERIVTIRKKGRFKVPKNTFEVSVSGNPERQSMPSQAIITIGTYGKFITN